MGTSQNFPKKVPVMSVNVLAVPQARGIAGTLAGKILNVLGMDWVGISQVLCPFPCDVLAMYWPGKLALVPSVCVLEGKKVRRKK